MDKLTEEQIRSTLTRMRNDPKVIAYENEMKRIEKEQPHKWKEKINSVANAKDIYIRMNYSELFPKEK